MNRQVEAVQHEKVAAKQLGAEYMRYYSACHDPSHGGSYVAEGAYFIRIGLPPRVVPGDFLNLSLYGLIRSLS